MEIMAKFTNWHKKYYKNVFVDIAKMAMFRSKLGKPSQKKKNNLISLDNNFCNPFESMKFLRKSTEKQTIRAGEKNKG